MTDTYLVRQAMSILDAAAKCSVGIIVFIEGERTALQAATTLRRIMKEMGDHTHKGITIRLSPTDPDHQIWIIRRELEEGGSKPEPKPSARNEIEIKL